MLQYFPTPYPDELWYSILGRYHVRSRDFALKNKSPCSACEFQAKQGISILGIKLLFFSV